MGVGSVSSETQIRSSASVVVIIITDSGNQSYGIEVSFNGAIFMRFH
jgi:hypothetical protein